MQAITEAMRSILKDHPGVSLCGGEVHPITRSDNGTPRRLPAYFNKASGTYDLLIPSSDQSAVVFLRTLSVSALQGVRAGLGNVVNIRVVLWANSERLTAAAEHLAQGLFSMCKVKLTGEGISRASVRPLNVLTAAEARGEWSGFDFEETETQFLMQPFFVGGFDVEATVVLANCTPGPQRAVKC